MNRSLSSTRAIAASSSLRTSASCVAVSNSGTSMSASARAQELEVRPRHQADQLLKGRLRLPAEVALRLGGVPDQVVDLGWAHERGIDDHVALPVAQAGLSEHDP